jgi:hypothetical protein
LMLRVRPGVLLVRASFVPSRELITLDFPTFDLPRKAISGTVGAGKWAVSLADNRKLANTLMGSSSVSPVPAANGKGMAVAIRTIQSGRLKVRVTSV